MHRWIAAVAFACVSVGSAIAGPPTPPEVGPDTDRDGLTDFQEVHKYLTDPKRADSDGDGKPDGDADERREFTYSIRLVVSHMPPAEAISDDWQDAREISRTADAVELEIVAYPLSTADRDIPDDREWRAKAKGFQAHTKANLTSDFDAATTKDVLAALRADGVDPSALGDRTLVERASKWAFGRSRGVDVGFTTYAITAKGDRLVVEPGCERYVDAAREREAAYDDRQPGPLGPKRTIDQQIDAEVRGRAMVRDRVHGSCTSSGIYLQTVLRSIGVPTRTTVAMPPADGNDRKQVEMLRNALRPSALRTAILQGPGTGWTEHTFNVVRAGGRWRRLNYSRLGQPIVDASYLGLLLRILDYDDHATSGTQATWGKRYAQGLREEPFPTANPYRLLEASDLYGPHARVALPAEAPEHRTLTITAARWTPDLPPRQAEPMAGRDALEVEVAEFFPDDRPVYAQYTRFAKEADVRFVLRAKDQPDVPAEYAWITAPRDGRLALVLATSRKDLREGVTYALEPRNETGTRRWAVADGVTVVR